MEMANSETLFSFEPTELLLLLLQETKKMPMHKNKQVHNLPEKNQYLFLKNMFTNLRHKGLHLKLQFVYKCQVFLIW